MDKHRQFLLDTGGHCYLCLKQVTTAPASSTGSRKKFKLETYHNNNDEGKQEEEEEVRSTFSFRNIGQYLKLPLKEVLDAAGVSLSSTGSIPRFEDFNLGGTLCSECAHLSERFSKHFLELEMVQMKLHFCLGSLHDRMLKVDMDNDDEKFKGEMESRPGGPVQLRIVEQLRKKTLERCSRKISSATPKVTLERLTDAGILQANVKTEPQLYLSSSDLEADFLDSRGPEVPSPEPILKPSTKFKSPYDGIGNHRPNCRHCGKEFRTKPLLRAHLRTNHYHLWSHICDMCGKKFTQGGALKRHRIVVHQVEVAVKTAPPVEELEMLVEDKTAEDKLALLARAKPKPTLRSSSEGRRYKCRTCSHLFSSFRALLIHRHSLHAKIRYECGLCGKEYSLSSALRSHHRVAHAGIQLKCEKCSKLFSSKITLRRHQRLGSCPFNPAPSTLQLQYCSTCGNSFRRASCLRRHVKTVHMKIRRSYTCDQCGKVFKLYRQLTSHRERVHPEVKPRQKLEVTIPTSIKPKPLKTLKSAAVTAALSIFQQNLKKVPPSSGEQICKDCGRKFDLERELIRHRRRDHYDSWLRDSKGVRLDLSSGSSQGDKDKPTPSSSTGLKVPQPPKKEAVVSQKQDEIFILPDVTPESEAQPDGDEPLANPKAEGIFSCKYCPKQFITKQSLGRHVAADHLAEVSTKWRNVASGVPATPTGNSTYFVNGPLEELEKLKPKLNRKSGNSKCLKCSKEFNCMSTFRRHYLSRHMPEVRYCCKLCGHGFPDPHLCDVHHRDVHEGIRYKCNGCSAIFTKLKFGKHLWGSGCGSRLLGGGGQPKTVKQ